MCHIYIDADSSGHISVIESVARKHNVPVTIICNVDHIFERTYADVKYVGKGPDEADFAIVNRCRQGDIVITRDYGLAAMVLSKHAYAINPNGSEFTLGNIDALLFKRHIRKTYGGRRKSGIKVESYKPIGIRKALEEKLLAI